jgi:GNAT superfamily N-acetyltransferase
VLFATTSLASRIEAAETRLICDLAWNTARRTRDDSVLIVRFGGGAAVIAGPGSPANKIAGLGFAPLDIGELDEVEHEFARRGVPLRAEVSSLADPSVMTALTARGYALSGFENVLGRAAAMEVEPSPAAIVVHRVAADAMDEWMSVVVDGFLHPDSFDGPPPTESFDRATIERAFGDSLSVDGWRCYLARRDGESAGGASLRIADGVALLCGAATLPPHRRRGVQTALLRERLRDLAAAGAEMAVVTTQPASKSQMNVQREGFELLYTRAVLTRS